MWRYIIKRLLLGLLTIFIISALIYILFAVLPGSFVSSLVNQKNQSAERKAQLLAYYGLDKPPVIRYFQWLWRLLHGDLDFSYSENEPVSAVIGRVIWPTIILMGFSYLVTLIIAIPIGIVSAAKQYSKLDTAVTAFSFFGFSLPNFWFGAILIAVFAFPHGGHSALLPLGGIRSGSTTDYFSNVGDLFMHLIMPTTVLVVQFVASYTRYVRSTMLDVLRMDYIRTARAKGLSGTTIILKHAFRNSLLPLITLMALDIPQLFIGAVITESVFNWPGMGQKFVAAARDHDGAILVGILVILSALVVTFNLLADLLYTWADPRISYEGAH